MKSALFLVAALVVVGCAHTPTEAEFDPYHRTVRFESDPPGARVFIGHTGGEAPPLAWEYLGTTPCTNKVACTDDGFVDPQYRVAVVSQFVPPRLVFMAIGNDRTNYVSLRGRTRWRSADKLPSALFFDLEK